jgi:hypothetical protein
MAVLFAPDVLVPLLATALALALAVALVLWRRRAGLRVARRRAAGYRLMECLRAYSAWIDWHRDEPLLQQEPEDSGMPAALAEAVQIKDAFFPELAGLMLQLLQTHRELMQYLWEENILRMTHASPLRPHDADPRYQDVRDRQDATLDSLFLRCRELIGDAQGGWRRTASDFSFSSGIQSKPWSPR